MIVKTEEYSGIDLLVDNNFNDDVDNPILRGVLRDIPLELWKPIMNNEELEIIDEGDDIKIDPEFYLNRSEKVLISQYGKVKRLSV